MADYEALYPGRFLKKEVLESPKVIRITAVTQQELEGDRGIETKVTVKYRAADGTGEIVWCKTNAHLVAHALDERDHTKWINRLITIAHDPSVRFGPKKVGGIRVFGSPEMKAAKKVTITNPRRPKHPEHYTLVPTDNQGRPRSGSAPASSSTDSTSQRDQPPPENEDADAPDFGDGEAA